MSNEWQQRHDIDSLLNEAAERDLQQAWVETRRYVIGALFVGLVTALAFLVSYA